MPEYVVPMTLRDVEQQMAMGRPFYGFISAYSVPAYELAEKGYKFAARTKTELVRETYCGRDALHANHGFDKRRRFIYWQIVKE